MPLSETVSNASTTTSREVVQFGMISVIHISAAKTKSAMTRCCTTVRPSIPKKPVGTASRKTVTASTSGSSTKYLIRGVMNSLFVFIDCI